MHHLFFRLPHINSSFCQPSIIKDGASVTLSGVAKQRDHRTGFVPGLHSGDNLSGRVKVGARGATAGTPDVTDQGSGGTYARDIRHSVTSVYQFGYEGGFASGASDAFDQRGISAPGNNVPIREVPVEGGAFRISQAEPGLQPR